MTKDGTGPGSSPPVPQDLRDALAGAQDGHEKSIEVLRIAVFAYVDELRRRGADYPETELGVRKLSDEIDRYARIRTATAERKAHLSETMVRWCRERWDGDGDGTS